MWQEHDIHRVFSALWPRRGLCLARPLWQAPAIVDLLTADILPYIAVGFAAQIIDGALGMAFGVISTSLLVGLGQPPAAASAAVKVIKMATGLVSGVSHAVAGNVDWKLFLNIAIPGTIGAILGAAVISYLPADLARLAIQGWLAIIGLYILRRAIGATLILKPPKIVAPLGLLGGFVDAAGGGGWGPVVTSNLIVQGASPRVVIGSVNAAEVLVAAAASGAFFVTLGATVVTQAALGLLVGGIVAAPFGAMLAKHIPAKPLMIGVGLLLMATSLYGLWTLLT
jgi:hypothetical protein